MKKLILILMVALLSGCVMMTANMPTKNGAATVKVFRVFQDVNVNYFEGGGFSYSTSSQPLADNLLILSQLAKTAGELYMHQQTSPIVGPTVQGAPAVAGPRPDAQATPPAVEGTPW